MPRKDSSKPDNPFADLTDEDINVPAEEREETPSEQEPVLPANESVVQVDEAAASAEESAPVKVAYDSSFKVPDGVSEVSVSVAGSGIIVLKTDGTPVEVETAKAELLLQSPAVKEAK